MKVVTLLLVCGLLTTLGGCVLAPVVPPVGLAFANITAPLDPNAAATPAVSKVGVASCYSIANIIAFGDCGLAAAAQNGHLSKMEYADYQFTNVFGIYQKFTLRVYGE